MVSDEEDKTSPTQKYLEKSEVCNECFYWRRHSNGYPNQHKTCLCELFVNQSICCLEGYSNLMEQIPYLILYAPTPNKYNYQSIDHYTLPIQLDSKRIIDIVNFASNVELNIVPKLKFPHKNYSFTVNAKD